MAINPAQTERAALCELFAEVGPDAHTLCGEWTTRDLAAHLVVRERRPDAAIGIIVSKAAGYTAPRKWPFAAAGSFPSHPASARPTAFSLRPSWYSHALSMNVTPASTACCTSRTASSLRLTAPRWKPPRPRALTSTPVRPNVRRGIGLSVFTLTSLSR